MLTLLRRRTSPFSLLQRQSGLAVLAADLLHALVHDASRARARAQAMTALARRVDGVLDALRAAADAVAAEGREPTSACRALTDQSLRDGRRHRRADRRPPDLKPPEGSSIAAD